MSKYTTEVRYICEEKCGIDTTKIPTSPEAVIGLASPKIFESYPIYNENYRNILNRKILKHYYLREIGFETYAMWRFKLNAKMNEIMPYYNELYRAFDLLKGINPFDDTDYTVKFDGTENTKNGGTDTLTRSYNKDISKELNTKDNTVNGGNNKTIYDTHDTRTDNLHNERVDDLTNLRTDDLTDIRTDDLTTQRTDNLSSTRTDNLNNQRTDNLNSQRTDNLHEAKGGTDWQYYSDTPQGTVSRLDNNTYLTNATKNTIDETKDNTGTQTTSNTGTQTTTNTGTQRTDDTGTQTTTDTGTLTTTNTGTQTTTNTGTQNIHNTGTQKYDKLGSETFETNTTQTTTKTGSVTDTVRGNDVDTKELDSTTDFVKDTLKRVKGKMGGESYAKLFKEYVDNLVNIDLLIIDELSDLFMNLW